jgi:heme/copper-type cytochrome/quinol oxidase subunit 1
MEYHDRVKFWIVMGPLWSIALAGLTGISILPADFDVFYHDTYVVVAKSHVILATLLLVILPLLALTIRHFRSASS